MAVTADDLQSYLGTEIVAWDRAEQLIALATTLCAAMVDPVPDAADAVILSATARAYLNPSGATAQTAGPYQQSLPSAGVYLTKAERATLRRLAGGSGAFTIDLLGSGYPDDRFPTS